MCFLLEGKWDGKGVFSDAHCAERKTLARCGVCKLRKLLWKALYFHSQTDDLSVIPMDSEIELELQGCLAYSWSLDQVLSKTPRSYKVVRHEHECIHFLKLKKEKVVNVQKTFGSCCFRFSIVCVTVRRYMRQRSCQVLVEYFMMLMPEVLWRLRLSSPSFSLRS